MKQKTFAFLLFLAFWLTLALPEPSPTTAAVPAGLTPSDWAHIQSQLSPQETTNWTEQAKLIADDAATNDLFGYAVAVYGDTAVIGASQGDSGSSNSGSAYVFVYSEGSWSQQAKLTANDAAVDDGFGYAVAIYGNTAVIGAAFDEDGSSGSSGSGSAYIFTRSGTTWSQQAKLTASDAAGGDNFGISVAISHNTAIIGSVYDDDGGDFSGSAYVFTRSGGNWSQQTKLAASDAAEGDGFGISVAVDGDMALIGAHGNDDVAQASGSAYIFTRSGTIWSEQAKLTASDAAGGDQFGYAVALSGNTAVIGTPSDDNGVMDSGSAYIFTRSGTIWSQQAKLTASDAAAEDQFGYSVALSGHTALVGTPNDDDGSSGSGSAYIFTRSGEMWSQQTKLTASDPAMLDDFGYAVALSGNTAVIGARFDDPSGSAYVFTLPTPPIYLPLIIAP